MNQLLNTLGLRSTWAIAAIGALSFLAINPAALGQVGNDPQPAAIARRLQPLTQISSTQVAPLDPVEVQKEDEADTTAGMAPRYAVPKPVHLTPQDSGTWERLDRRTQVWRLRVESPGAKSINLGFTRYVMPPGGQLFIYSQDMTDIIRPFTNSDNASHGELWTPPVNGDKLVIELTLPDAVHNQLDLVLGSINIGYRRFGDKGLEAEGGIASGSCNVDVVCPEGLPWVNEIPAVGVISTGGSRFCTGFMVNNTAQDRKGYFMTAFHCGVTTANAASLVVFWNYQNSTCRPVGSAQSGAAGNGSLATFSTGSTFRAAFSTSDFTLVELSQPINPAWNLSWAGWDHSSANSPSGACIHHPNTDEKRISFYTTTTNNSSWPCSFPTGDNSHVRAVWSLGVTEPGSSGSPLFDNNHHIIGQLHGGPSACGQVGDNLSDCYGRFGMSWAGGGTDATRLSNWLDPLNTGAISLNTLVGSGLSVTPTTNVTHIGVVGGPFTNNPTNYTISNTTPTPANYSVSIVGGGTAPILINGGTSTLSGSVSGNSAVNIVVSLDPAANLMAAGVYATTVQFNDTTNNVQVTRVHTLEIGQIGYTTVPANGLSAGGPVGGPFSATQVYTVTSTRPTPVTVRVAAGASWISINGGSGPVDIALNGTGATANVTIGYSAAANALPAGIVTSSVTFTNITAGGAGSDTSRPVTLDVGRFTYTAIDTPIAIPDNVPAGVNSVINVTDNYCVGDVDVIIKITHTFVGDLKLVLTHGTTSVAIIDRPGVPASTNGCAEDNYNNILLDDEGSGGPIETQCLANLTSPPSYTPNNPLSGFDGATANGLWTLNVSDNAGVDTGSLVTFTLKVAASGQVCPPMANNVAVTVPVIATSPITLSGSTTTGNPLNYIVTSLPLHGTLSDPNGGAIAGAPYTLLSHGSAVNYKPSPIYAGADNFTYKVNDGQDSLQATVSITVGGPQMVFNFNLDTNPGWTTMGQWAWGHPTGGGSHALDPANGFTGANVYGYNLAGDYPSNLTPTQYLTTTAINCSNLSSCELRFKRWLGVESSTYDHANIQVSNNGTTWVDVWNHTDATAISENAWSSQAYPIGATADGQSTLYIRWGMGVTDGSVTYPGWNIDDVQIWAVRPPCLADVTGNGVVNVDDLLNVINHWGACPGCTADIAPPGGNGVVNVDDLLAVINGWGTCP